MRTLAAILLLASPAAFALESKEPPLLRLSPDVVPTGYRMTLDVDPHAAELRGEAWIDLKLHASRSDVRLHGNKLATSVVELQAGKATIPGTWKQIAEDGTVDIALAQPAPAGAATLHVVWTAPYNAQLEGIYKVEHEGDSYVFTQFEAISARESFPCFDEPGFKTPFSLTLVVPKGEAAFANMPEASSSVEGDKRRVTFATTPPLPTYLLAFAVGPLEVQDGPVLPPNELRKTSVRGIAPKGKQPGANAQKMKRSLELSARLLAELERYFGAAYAYSKMDIVAVPDFAAGAMENPGLVTFRDVLLYVDDSSPIGLQKGNASVIAHEFAHQWFGDLVTLAWWDDIWLNEAFASWLENKIVDAVKPEYKTRTDARAELDGITGRDSLVTARQIREPVLKKGDIINAFDGITYSKGASVIGMFEGFLGEVAFRRGVRAYIAEHRHGTATAADLLDALSRNGKRDIKAPFSTFTDQPGVPQLDVDVRCDKDKGAVLSVAQSRYLPIGSTGDRNKTWGIPVCARYLDGASWKSSCALIDKARGEVPLPMSSSGACPAVVHPNDDGRGYYRWTLPGERLKALSAQWKALSDGERISFGNAVRGGFSNGTLPFADAIAAALPMATDREASVAYVPHTLLWFAHDELVDESARPKVKRALAQAYRPALDEVGVMPKDKDTPEVRGRRAGAVDALLDAEDPALLQKLAPLGRAYLGVDDGNADKTLAVHPDKVHADLVGAAVTAAVIDDGAKGAVFARCQQLMFGQDGAGAGEQDPLVRRYLLGCLGAVRDPALVEKALPLSLHDKLRVNEVGGTLWGISDDVRTRERAWAFAQQSFDKLVARMPENAGAGAPRFAGNFCSAERAAEVQAFFEGKTAKYPGMARTLAQVTENIRLCAAKKSAQQKSAREYFK